ncbi:MAG: type II secretion system F family protein [Paracoccaceae bacterium]
MARFSYKGVGADGKADEGWVDGRDTSEAYATLQSRGIAVFELNEGGASGTKIPWYARDIPLGRQGYGPADQAALAELIATLSKLGLPLTEMLRIMAANTANPSIRNHVERTSARVADGVPLAEAFEAAGAGFSPMFLQISRVAGVANTLPASMEDVARYLRRAEQTRSKVSSALIYPSILIVAGCVLMAVIVIYLAPALAPMFSALGRPMPSGLSMFLWIGAGFEQHGLFIVLTLAVGLAVIVIASLSDAGRRAKARLALRLPFVGSINRDALLLRHVSALAMLLRSGMPLVEALEASANLGEVSPYEPTFHAAAGSLRDGGRASAVFQAEPSMSELFQDLFSVGEAANRLNDTLPTVVQVLEQRLDRGIQRTLQILTPALTVILGGLIGVLVYSVMGAILDINAVAL